MRKYFFTIWVITGILLLGICTPVNGQWRGERAAVPFIENNDHVRSKALGGATVALRNHTGGIHLNPAVIGNPGNVELTTQFAGMHSFPLIRLGRKYPLNDSKFYMPSMSVSFDRWSVAYQMTYQVMNLGIYRIPQNPEGRALPDNREQVHTVSAVYRWGEHVSVGGGINFIHSKLAERSVDVSGDPFHTGSAVSIDLGAYGEYPFDLNDNIVLKSSAGWSLTDFGGMIEYDDAQQGDPLPMKMRLGLGAIVAYTDPVQHIKLFENKRPVSIGFYRSFEKELVRRDPDTGEPMSAIEALFGAWDSMDWPSYDPEVYPLGDQIGHRFGMEVILFEMVSIRQGYRRSPEIEGGGKLHRFGFGLQYGPVALDYVRLDRELSDFDFGSNHEFWQLSVQLSTERVMNWFK